MNSSEIKNIILKSEVLNNILSDIDQQKKLFIRGLAGSLKALFLSILFEQKNRSILYITAEDEQEEIIKEDMEILLGSDQVTYIPKIRELATDDIIVDSIRKSQLLSSLEKLVEKKKLLTIVSAKNIALKFPSPEWIKRQRIVIVSGKEYKFDFLKERLVELGFNREAIVESCGEISVRGGIIDIYPFSSDYPFRVEFFGDIVESIRMFDPATQRSIDHISQIVIYPQHPEIQDELEKVPLVSLLDYFDKSAIIFQDETELIKKEIEEFFHFNEDFYNKKRNEEQGDYLKQRYLTWDDLNARFKELNTIAHISFIIPEKSNYYNLSTQVQENLKGNLQLLKQKIELYSQQITEDNSESYKLYFLCDNSEQVERIEDILEDAGINISVLAIRNLGLSQGFVFKDVGLIVFTDNQFYGKSIRWRRRKSVRHGLTLQQLNSLSIDDYVVHVDHGIGQFKGLKKIIVQGNERECLSIIYQNGDYLYVPLDRMNRIQKYSAKEGVVPSLSKLGSKDWDRLKKKTKKHIKNIAKELIELYAKRKSQKGHAFAKDTLWQRELEESFQYEDTPDQQKATEEIKQDMESSYPMDRLVCGDVGYGKTEVALRAAFKAVNDSKQVAILVPTTVLALQHYNLFHDRIGKYPIKVEMLSRFRRPSEQKKIVEWLKQGRIDIVIGTHRVLSKDVQFKDIGLLIIDEEHRFGVRNKELLKQIQINVDVLSMSATPIPRTLNMSLLGIRDMSLITTPPRDRLPIYTEITPFDKDLIRMAILKEVERGGQVFFVHNRIQSINSIANLLRRIVPEVTFAIAHGQMDERQLEKVMWDFATRKYQCLISTMIIESGLDIPNVNTLIVNRADRFGLSQLYQLRGRVGRSNQRAYAYLLVPPLSLLNQKAMQRLRIIEEFTELGSGFKIATRDLEIRGTGNIFGAEQSGNIVALGYELYVKIIEEAIEELKLEKEGKAPFEVSQKEEAKVEINQDIYIPDDYIEQSELRVDIYRRLANEKDLSMVSQIKEELQDRFGKLPQAVINLFNVVELKIIGNQLNFKRVKINNNALLVFFNEDITYSNNRELIENRVCSIINKSKNSFHVIQDGKDGLGVHFDIPKTKIDAVEYSKNFLKGLL